MVFDDYILSEFVSCLIFFCTKKGADFLSPTPNIIEPNIINKKYRYFHQGVNINLRHLYCTLKARGVRGFDVKGVSLDFTGFAGLHPYRLLDLKYKNAFAETYRRVGKYQKNEAGLS